MSKLIFIPLFALVFSVNVFAHTAFTLVSSEKKTIRESDISRHQGNQTAGTVEGHNLTFSAKEIRLLALTGPEDDMLSYHIQGVRNPNLVVPAGAMLRILFVNVDADMRHDIRFGHVMGDFPIAPEIAETAGTSKLAAKPGDGTLQAEEIVIKANENGAYKYFCSVRGHARDGMWGNILVGVKPGEDIKMAEKQVHVHTADEDHDHPAGTKHDEKKPETKKPDDHMQHQPGHQPGHPPGHQPEAPSGTAEMLHGEGGHSEMRSSVNIGEPMSREGSGTSWLPDSSPMHAYMKMFEDGGMLMLHGTMFFRYTSIGSSRDASVAGKGSRSRFDAPSMFMAMYSRPINEKSQIGLRAMLSLDPVIQRGYGYPLLYQSGETYRGEPLHDRQHPHDFVSELAATYSYKFDNKRSFYIYAGLPGEPALGPPMYLHRLSGMNNPDAPIGHHWQDATHITFGVLTAGFTHDKFKFEASAFKGREPDENRWAFDSPKLDSFSGRLSFNPTKEWAFQVSYGYLKNPEPAEPEVRILRRTTASAIYNRAFDDERNWSNAFIWGQNHTDEGRTNSFLFESNYDFYKNSIFGRAEQVQKNAHELVLPPPHPEGNLWVQAYSIGYLRDVIKDKGLDVGLGGMATFNFNPASISSFYGGTKHAGWQFFIRVRPSKHR